MPRVKFSTSGVRPEIGIFSYGSSKEASETSGQFEFDVSSLRDPSGQKQFNGFNGVYPNVRDWVGTDRRVPIIIRDCLLLADDLIKPKPQGDSKVPKAMSVWLSFSFKDFHGKWIAPAVAELVAERLSKEGFNVAVHHKCIPEEQFPKIAVESK